VSRRAGAPLAARTRERGAVSRWALLLALGIVVAVGTTALLVTIVEHKQEARNPFFRVVDLSDTTEDPAVWGKNFPFQYDAYRRTTEMRPTRFGGSEAVARVPTTTDPRTVVARSKLDADPRLKIMWAGYAFAVDYRERRGHAYMLEDQMFTGRQQASHQPGTCLHCHTSAYVPYLRAGNGDLMAGFARLNPLPYDSARKWFNHPVACIDCHDPRTMQLRVTRPAFIEGIRALKASQGIQDYDVNTMATRQEMRSFVCGQCHVEYYFRGPEKRLVYPWGRGLSVDSELAFEDADLKVDWTHALTGAPVLKAQHPEFEMWSQGVHARAGVACADCHMPYMREGAQKISDHWVRSPLLDINRACQTCHRYPEDELKARVETIQLRTAALRSDAMDALVGLVGDLANAVREGRSDAQLATARALQRRAQFLLDYVDAENSTGFHAPQEAARILGESMNLSRQGQIALRDPAFRPEGLPAGSVQAIATMRAQAH
jgi:nitrite reductase (cytochrome c-552)